MAKRHLSTGQGDPEFSRVRFAEIKSRNIHIIPARSEISNAERNCTWYQPEEIEFFKKKASFIISFLIAKGTNANTKKPKAAHGSFDRDKICESLCPTLESQICSMIEARDPSICIPVPKEYRRLEKCGVVLRGFEYARSDERQFRKQLAIRAVLCRWAKHKEDRISLFSRRLTSWSCARAYEMGRYDALVAAAIHSDVKSSDLGGKRKATGTNGDQNNILETDSNFSEKEQNVGKGTQSLSPHSKRPRGMRECTILSS